ncbi:MAG: ECF transporter S component [Eubacteriales bacterium]|nr:ECF transporter S component [Eubacteriales bacterium]
MNMTKTHKMTVSAMLFALGLVLPFLTGQIPQIGQMLCPMHIPVFLCGLICGWPWGAAVGFLLPLVRSVLFGMPVIFPNGIAMAFELATYGLVAGLIYFRKGYFCLRSCYVALITAMIAGRVVWGLARCVLLGFGGTFTWKMFVAGALLNAIPGIILHLILVPGVMLALGRTGLVPFEKKDA